MVTFKQANVPAMQSKLFQFDEALRNEIVSLFCFSVFVLIFLMDISVNVDDGNVP